MRYIPILHAVTEAFKAYLSGAKAKVSLVCCTHTRDYTEIYS